MQGKHYKVKSVPYNPTYIDAFNPRLNNGYIFWFDDGGRERAARAKNFITGEDGTIIFENPDREETITFEPVDYDVMLPPFWNNTYELENVCAPSHEGKAYFRPYLCRGDITVAKTFLVGINPATPIYPEDISPKSYAKTLQNPDEFLRFYISYRRQKGKRGLSPTRRGIDSFGRWLEEWTGSPVVETNIIAYPTSNEDYLKQEPSYIHEKGKQIFRSLLLGIKPKNIVLHGSIINDFVELLGKRGVKPEGLAVGEKITEMEQHLPVLTFNYTDGQKAEVFACRHLSLYQRYRKEHEAFRWRLERYLNKKNIV